jgi:VanZ family protein
MTPFAQTHARDSRLPLSVTAVACLLAALSIAGGLFYFGAKPIAVGLIASPWDKLAHFGVYSAITALLLWGTRMRWPVATVLLVCALGSGDELYQLWLPGRSADVADLFTDVLAGVVTCATLLTARTRAHAKRMATQLTLSSSSKKS